LQDHLAQTVLVQHRSWKHSWKQALLLIIELSL